MQKRIRVFLISALFICPLLCLVIFQIVVHGCILWECAPQRAFRVLELDLPANLFPSQAIVNKLYPRSESDGTLEDGLKSVYWGYQGSGIANYLVRRFSAVHQAIEVLSLDKKNIFVDRITKEPWAGPAQLKFSSSQADEFYIVCGNWNNYRCGMLGRYEEYVITFNAVIDTEMTYQDFEQIAMFIDRQITERLYP